MQLQQLKECIAASPIKKACLLGIKPAEAQKELIDVLTKKSSMQVATGGTAIEMNHTEVLKQDLVADFNRQFRQQAIDRQKISMRFEPSRLGAAYAKGLGSFFAIMERNNRRYSKIWWRKSFYRDKIC
ncbi:hypothetical protein [Legionella tunisiensis]|uniref:hypothetical protein n=1 Tax=Legionella tunisiensis TaxID=1034944 RepID=UPI0002D894D4|nr:hypothetical protein [Legionella tunisiensis]